MATKTKTNRKGVSKAKVTQTMRTLTAKRTAKRDLNAKRGVKRHYEDKGANYLLTAVAQALNLPAITKHEVRTSPHTVRVDVRQVVRHLTPNLYKRPDLTINARLLSLAKVDRRVGKVGYLRVLVNGKGNPAIDPKNPQAYEVLLYRKTK